jgi:hypothetical protein
MPGWRALAIAVMAAFAAGMTETNAGAMPDCSLEAAALNKEEAELPRLEVAPPADHQITCITLETVIAFAGRLKAHIARCPETAYSGNPATWEATRVDYSKRFAQRRCRRTLSQ